MILPHSTHVGIGIVDAQESNKSSDVTFALAKRQRILTKVQHAKEHIARAVTLKPAMDITALGELTDILKEKNDALDTTLKERSPVTAEIAAKQTKIYEELAKEGQI